MYRFYLASWNWLFYLVEIVVFAQRDFELTRSVSKDKMRFFTAVIVSELKDTANDNNTISIFRPRISSFIFTRPHQGVEPAKKRQGDIAIQVVSAPV